jgi:hypothetical protein
MEVTALTAGLDQFQFCFGDRVGACGLANSTAKRSVAFLIQDASVFLNLSGRHLDQQTR